MENKPFINIYIFEQKDLTRSFAMPEWRVEEIERANVFDKDDKEFIWRALTLAVQHSFNVALQSLNPRKLFTGKPVLDFGHISLSHSGSHYMVAISSHNIGVDIMKNSEYRYYALSEYRSNWSKAEQAIVYKEEKSEPFFITWTKKEALYKFLDPGFPYKENKAKVDTTKYEDLFYVGSIQKQYDFFAICSELLKKGIVPRVITNLEIDE